MASSDILADTCPFPAVCRLHWWALTGVLTLSDLRFANSSRLSTVQSWLKLPTRNTDGLFLGGPAATNFQLSSSMLARIGWLFLQFDCTGSGSTKLGSSVRVRVSCCAEPEAKSICPDCCPGDHLHRLGPAGLLLGQAGGGGDGYEASYAYEICRLDLGAEKIVQGPCWEQKSVFIHQSPFLTPLTFDSNACERKRSMKIHRFEQFWFILYMKHQCVFL